MLLENHIESVIIRGDSLKHFFKCIIVKKTILFLVKKKEYDQICYGEQNK